MADDELREQVARALAEHITADYASNGDARWLCTCDARGPVAASYAEAAAGAKLHIADAVLAAIDLERRLDEARKEGPQETVAGIGRQGAEYWHRRFEEACKRLDEEGFARISGFPLALATARQHAGAAIAYRIEAELVCCDIYEQHAKASTYDETVHGHALCYWGEAAAGIARSYPWGRDEEPTTEGSAT